MMVAGQELELPWQGAQWSRLADLRRQARLPHAILLKGVQGLGKGQFARRLGRALVCASPTAGGDACGACAACRQSAAGNHPDLRWVAPEEPGKMIRIDAIRELSSASMLAAQEGGFRVIVIEPADAMNQAAANALLKTLEEPASRTVLVLVSSRPDRLPATIRSRCHAVAFSLPSRAELDGWLSAMLPAGELEANLAIAGGAPLRAILAHEQDWLADDRQLIEELAQLKNRSSNPMQVVENWAKRPLRDMLDSLKRCTADLVRLGHLRTGAGIFHPGDVSMLHTLVEGIDLKDLHSFNDDLFRLERESHNNLNPQMMFEYLANRWLRFTRPGGR
ncbi:MAG: DNA polymerase III subunit delta' [Gammaproteobacteria bacterium]|nr:DNA polymerase III subunit delta' [Gammaproteobacteria bacterium]